MRRRYGMACAVALGMLGLSLFLAERAFGQQTSVQWVTIATQYATEIERFLARRGEVCVWQNLQAGKISNEYQEELSLDLLVLSAPSSDSKVFGFKFSKAKQEGRERYRFAYLDLDEVKGLLESLTRLEKLSSQMLTEEHENTEVHCKTKGSLDFGFYQTAYGQRGFVEIQGESFFLTMDQLKSLRARVTEGVERLKKLGAK